MPRKKIISSETTASSGEFVAAGAEKPRRSAARTATAANRTSRRRTAAAAKENPELTADAEISRAMPLDGAVSEEEQIALLAYSFWEARGRQGGSPEDDWYRAEREIRRRGETASKTQ